jgi:hypothetical protein
MQQLASKCSVALLSQAMSFEGTRHRAGYYLTLLKLTNGEMNFSDIADVQLDKLAKSEQSFVNYLKKYQASFKSKTGLQSHTPAANEYAEYALLCIHVGAACKGLQAQQYTKANSEEAAILFASSTPGAQSLDHLESKTDLAFIKDISKNSPVLLTHLSFAYLQKQNFDSCLSILYTLAEEFPYIRVLQEAIQGIYLFKQKSSGDVRIL